MERKVYKQEPRNKAFLGSLVGGIASGIGSIISANKKKKAEALAFQQQQTEQYRMEGVQQGASLTSQYANQDYVDQYQDKVTLKAGGKVNIDMDRISIAKKNSPIIRKKAAFGYDDMVSGISKEGEEATKDANQGFANAVSVANGANVDLRNIIPSLSNAIDGILGNRKSAADALAKKTKDKDILDKNKNPYMDTPIAQPLNNNLDVTPTNPNYDINPVTKVQDQEQYAKFGKEIRRKKVDGGLSGIGSLVGSILYHPKAPPLLKKTDGFTYDAPKTGLVNNSYQVDANGNPITMLNPNQQVIDPTQTGNNMYGDRVQQAKMGKRIKQVAKSNNKYM